MAFCARSVLLAAVLLALLVVPSASQAAPGQPGQSLQVEPARLDVAARPGDKYQGKLAVTNTNPFPAAVRFYVVDRRVQPKGKTDLVRGLKLPTSSASWIAITPYEESLKAGERREIDWTLTLPDDVSAGDFVAVVFAEVVPKGPPTTATPDRSGMMLVVSVPGNAPYSGKITMLSSPPDRIVLLPKLFSKVPEVSVTVPEMLRVSHPIRTSFSFVNEGAFRTEASGSIVVTSAGRVIQEIPAGVASEVFPGDAVDFEGVWTDPPDFGLFTVAARTTIGGARTVEDGFTVYLFPPELAVGIPLMLLLLVFILFLVRRMRSAREFREFEYMSDYDVRDSPPSARSRFKPGKGAKVLYSSPAARQVRASAARAAMDPALENTAASSPSSDEQATADGGSAGAPELTAPPSVAAERETVEAGAEMAGIALRQAAEKTGASPGRFLTSRDGRQLSPEVQSLLGSGLAAMQVDARADAYGYFSTAAERDPDCVAAWLLKAGTAPGESEAEECLRRALALDPDNTWAVEGLHLLWGGTGQQPTI